MKKQPDIKKQQVIKKPETIKKLFSWREFSIKILGLFIVILLVVIYTDRKGYFTADQSNNHIRRKWISFYNYTKTKDVDVVILGNSHIITGVDPFVLSDATSSTCFILGNSGTNIMDAWFQLGEGLKRSKPKLVILETYCISNGNKPEGAAIPYLQSFDAQNDVWYKMQCMPQLFYSDRWVEAWSPSVRNHSFLLTDRGRINYNIKNPKEPISNKLDLGRFARFDFGLQDSTLAKYDSMGSPVKGKEYQISGFCKKYLREIMAMCKEKNIPVLFFTVPMYYKHIDDYAAWKSTLNEELQKYPQAKWLDLQAAYDTIIYTPDKFENTYDINQHLSNSGMVATAYELAAFINSNYPGLLPDRSKDEKWVADFKTTGHFVYNQDVAGGMEGFISIIKDKQVGNFHIRELALQENKESSRLILKIDRQENLPNELTVQYAISIQGNNFNTPLQMISIRDIFPPQHKVYVADIRKDIKINDILTIAK